MSVLPFAAVMAAHGQPKQQPLAWWMEGRNQYTNVAGTTSATVAADPIRNWTDVISGYAVTQAGTGPNFPPELHTDLLAVRFDGDPNFLSGAATFADVIFGAADTTGAASFNGLLWDVLFFAGAINDATRLHWEARVA